MSYVISMKYMVSMGLNLFSYHINENYEYDVKSDRVVMNIMLPKRTYFAIKKSPHLCAEVRSAFIPN